MASTSSNTNHNTKNDNKKRWFPLESNPTLMNNYISKLGFDTSFYQFVDVFSTDDWALDMIPQPCTAVIMLYPITKVQEDWRREEQLLLEKENKERGDSDTKKDESQEIWYIKQ